MMLLRKAHLPEGSDFHVLPSCVEKYKEYFEIPPGDGTGPYIAKKIRDGVRDAFKHELIFENPSNAGQYIAYAKVGYTNVWFVVAENESTNPKHASHVVITLLVAKDTQFEDEMAAVEAARG